MIQPQYYPILADALERKWPWPARQRTIRFATATTPPTITWEDGQPAPTDDQISAACVEWLAARRKPKAETPLATELFSYMDTPAKVRKVLSAVAAQMLRQDPGLLRRFGEAIDGDEPVG